MTTTITAGTLTLPAARVGGNNPLPPVDPTPTLPATDVGLPEDLLESMSYGAVRSVFPYLIQDGYDRDRTDSELATVVIENHHLRATFATGLGGRLMSLVDKASDRELLSVNEIFQPANLALRNAWFSGGVEWNIGTTGHSPLTCSPLYAATVEHADGSTSLRLWEFERMRGLVFQLDIALAPDAPVLVSRVRIRNPGAHTVPVYWWTNMAIAESAATRVLAPAERAFVTNEAGGLSAVGLDANDVSRPSASARASDVFFDVDENAPWIAALDDSGRGIAHVSSAQLRGRKLFVWGQHPGGRRWNEWLSGRADAPYVEIQAGLARTQREHVPLGGGQQLAWTEAIGPVSVAASVVHDSSWSVARREVGAAVADALPAESIRAVADVLARDADAVPETILATGSGWGHLESRLHSREHPAGTPFAIGGGEEEFWVRVLDGTAEVDPSPLTPPASYVAGDDWVRVLAALPATWLTRYHLATIAHASGDLALARLLYLQSVAERENAWALRGLARLDLPSRHGLDRLVLAHQLAPDELSIAREALVALLDAAEPTRALELIDGLRSAHRANGRIRLLEAQLAVAAGDVARARALVDEGIEVADLREGDVSLSELWRAVHGGEPIPARYDFEMN